MRLDEVASAMEVSAAKISRLETGRAVPKVWDVRNLLTLYGIDDERAVGRLVRWANEGKATGWWSPHAEHLTEPVEYYLSLEAEAAAVSTYCSSAVHGLLQTEAYARAVLRALAPDADPAAQVRISEGWEKRGETMAAIQSIGVEFFARDEAALRRVVGSPEVMREQLRGLLDHAEMPNVTVQVFPFAAGAHQAIVAAFTVFVPRVEEVDPVVVHIEGTLYDAFEEQADHVRRYEAVFHDLSRRALDPAASRALIDSLLDA